MSRVRLIALIAILGALVSIGEAQDASLPDAHAPDEEEALQLLSDGMAVGARTQAERVLRRDPDSVVGHYVLGRVLFEAEGSLGRAMFHLGRARELHERSTLDPHSPFHQQLLYTTSRLAGQMELYDYQLELLGYYDHLYDPDLVAERCWPLMKLERQDEARQFASIAVNSPNPWQRSAGLNAMCALEGEARTREPYFNACLAALEDARRGIERAAPDEEQPGIAVDAYNAALAATVALRFEEAERYALEGVQRFEPTGADPWQLLVELYLSEARMDDALGAFASMIRWNDRQPASMRDQGRAETEAVAAIVLLLAGETVRADERIDRALARPDRRGLTTDGAEQARGRHALLRRIIRRTLEEERAERASWTGLGARVSTFAESIPRRVARWPDDERILGVLADDERLVDTLRPFMAGGITGLSPWLTGEIVSVLGPAIVAVALAEARARDAQEPRATPFYDALEVEIAAARGDGETAVALAQRILPQLAEARGFALVRARVAAIAAAAADDAGMEAQAYELYATALEIDPGVLRRLGLALPISISHRGGDSESAASLLASSPRTTERDGALALDVEPTARGLRACLRTASGNELRCVEASAPPETDEARAAEAERDPELATLTLPQRLAREVHREMWSARVELSRVDLSSLDGRPIGGSTLANERLRQLVDEP
ncbi:hypothetical protein [Sandaracinus amylolyticus]|uniref:hypothetical protein n=1 Tax=Sandaracinus amylolyticus TaxID=927083 RepID=UPI0012ECF5C4|nr:hypothetical protein [Sandaracinus amylolyticus]